MTDDLVQQLSDSKGWQNLGRAAARRITALEAELDYWRNDSAAAWGKCEENRKDRDALAENLAKAVDALRDISKQSKGEGGCYFTNRYNIIRAIKALEALGEKP